MMHQVLLTAIAFSLVVSCGVKKGGDFTYRTDEKQGKIFIERKTIPGRTAFEIVFSSADISLNTVADFCVGALERFSELSVPYDPAQGTVRIGPESDLYRIFFQLGVFSLSEMKNSLMRMGFIQSEWRKWTEESGGRNDSVSALLDAQKNDLFRIAEFRELVTAYCTNREDRDQVYSYAASYLLKQVLFISLQEILARPYRYDQPREAGSVFSQVVILPETVAFNAYLEGKFGRTRTLMASKAEFTTNHWKRTIGEDFHDTEADFASRLEDREYKGVFLNRDFRDRLDSLLEVYNKMTKSTMFRK